MQKRVNYLFFSIQNIVSDYFCNDNNNFILFFFHFIKYATNVKTA